MHAEEEGGWTLFAPSQEAMSEAEQMVDLLLAEEKEDDHPDIREIRRRVAANLKEMVDLDHI